VHATSISSVENKEGYHHYPFRGISPIAQAILSESHKYEDPLPASGCTRGDLNTY